MSAQQSIATLQSQVAFLETQVQNSKLTYQNWFRSSDIFNSSYFHTQSDDIKDYVKEIKTNIERLAKVKDQTHADYLSDMIAHQFGCFKNLLNSGDLNSKYAAHRGKHIKLQQRVKNIAQQATQTSQSLYEELSKLHEYERRLIDMVADKQASLNQHAGANKSELQQQVLLTQQRLGRCRQAITGVEDKIQQLDSRQ